MAKSTVSTTSSAFPVTSDRLQMLMSRKKTAFPSTLAKLQNLLLKNASSVSNLSSIAPVHSNYPTLGAFPFGVARPVDNNSRVQCDTSSLSGTNRSLAAVLSSTRNPRSLQAPRSAAASICGPIRAGITSNQSRLDETSSLVPISGAKKASIGLKSPIKRLQQTRRNSLGKNSKTIAENRRNLDRTKGSVSGAKKIVEKSKESGPKGRGKRSTTESRASIVPKRSNLCANKNRSKQNSSASTRKSNVSSKIKSDKSAVPKSGRNAKVIQNRSTVKVPNSTPKPTDSKGNKANSASFSLHRSVSTKRGISSAAFTNKKCSGLATASTSRATKMQTAVGTPGVERGFLRFMKDSEIRRSMIMITSSPQHATDQSLLDALNKTRKYLQASEKSTGKIGTCKTTVEKNNGKKVTPKVLKKAKPTVKRLQNGKTLSYDKSRKGSMKEEDLASLTESHGLRSSGRTKAVDNIIRAKGQDLNEIPNACKKKKIPKPTALKQKPIKDNATKTNSKQSTPTLAVYKAKSMIPVRTQGKDFSWRNAILQRTVTHEVRTSVSTATKRRQSGKASIKNNEERKLNKAKQKKQEKNGPNSTFKTPISPSTNTGTKNKKDINGSKASSTISRTTLTKARDNSKTNHLNVTTSTDIKNSMNRSQRSNVGVRHSPRQTTAATSEKIAASLQSPKLYRLVSKEQSDTKSIIEDTLVKAVSPKKTTASSSPALASSELPNNQFKVPLPFSQHNVRCAPANAKILSNWIPMLKGSQLRVEGHLMKDGVRVSENDMDLWKSSVIVKRDSRVSLRTKSGGIYVLQGCMDEKRAEECLVPPFVIKEFKSGFPANWVRVLDRWSEWKRSMSSNVSTASFESDMSVVPCNISSIEERGAKRSGEIGCLQPPSAKRSRKRDQTHIEGNEENVRKDKSDGGVTKGQKPRILGNKSTNKAKPNVDEDIYDAVKKRRASQVNLHRASTTMREVRVSPRLSKSHSLSMRTRRLMSTKPELHSVFDTSITSRDESRKPLRLLSPAAKTLNKIRDESAKNDFQTTKAPLSYHVGYEDFIASTSQPTRVVESASSPRLSL